MGVTAGIVLILLGLVAWGGQLVSVVSWDRAVRLGLQEAEDNVEPAFLADARAEALWDVFTLWPLIVAGALLAAGSSEWPFFGLVGGATYLYFGGRGILTRREMMRMGLRIGDSGNVAVAWVMLAVWAAAGLGAVVSAWIALS